MAESFKEVDKPAKDVWTT